MTGIAADAGADHDGDFDPYRVRLAVVTDRPAFCQARWQEDGRVAAFRLWTDGCSLVDGMGHSSPHLHRPCIPCIDLDRARRLAPFVT